MAVQSLKHVPIQCDTVREGPDRAIGDGTGIIMVAETSTGCLLGASGIGERGVPAEQIASKAADELVDAVHSGACVDQWCRTLLHLLKPHSRKHDCCKHHALTVHLPV